MAKPQGPPLTEIYMENGALHWAAPELLQQNQENMSVVVPTPESDIYSFGGIMWQVCAALTCRFDTAADSVTI